MRAWISAASGGSNETHQSTTDPDARLYKKGDGRPAQLAYGGHLLMENRSGLIVQACVLPADGFGERDAALIMAQALPGARVTLGADKGYDYPAFVAEAASDGGDPRTWRRTRRIAAVRLMPARRAILAMRSVSANGSSSNKPLAG